MQTVRTPIYWLERPSAEPERHTLSSSLSVAPSGPRAAVDVPAAMLIPVHQTGSTIAAMLVPQALVGTVTLDGVRVPAGLHSVCHATRIALSETTLWVAARTEPETRPYDPVVDGADLYCSRTKARIVPGETIVICHGSADVACDQVYKQSAWELDIPCHACKRSPNAPEWHPPLARATERGGRSKLLAAMQARRPS